MKVLSRSTVILGVVVSAAAFAAAPAAAQECVEGCDPCGGWNEWEPYWIEDGYEWYYGGCAEGEGCQWCLRLGAVDDAPADAATLGALIVNAPIVDLPRLVTDHGSRLEIHPTRALLVVRGTLCEPDADLVSAVLVLTPEKAREIRAVGLNQLREPTAPVRAVAAN